MQKFPIKIDLSTFFDDERKYVLILVDPQWEDVACLQQRVEQIFDVEAVRFQTNDNFFIPPQEPIEVVKFAEALKAFIPKKSLEKSRRKSKKSLHDETATLPEGTMVGDEKLQPVQEAVLKKRKYYSLGNELSSSTPNQPKRSKNVPLAGHVTMACDPTGASKSQEITSTSEQQPPEPIMTLKDEIVAEELVAVKPKRKRAKKTKTKHSQKECGDGEGNAKNQPAIVDQSGSINLLSGLPSSTFISQSSKKKMSKYDAPLQEKSHMRFSESKDVNMVSTISTTALDQTADATPKNAKPKVANVIFRCSLDDIEARKPRVFNCKGINANQKKCDVHIREHIVLPPVTDIGLIAEAPVADNDAKTLPTQMESSEQVSASDTVAVQVIDTECVSQADEAAKTEPDNEEVAKMDSPAHESIAVEVSLHHESAGDASSSQINDVTIDVTENAETSAASDSVLLEESNVIDLDDEENTNCSEPDLTEIIDLSENENVGRALRSSNAISISLNESFDPGKMSAAEMLPYSTVLQKRPAPGDILLFKLECQKYASKRKGSPFIAGRCEHINRRTQQIQIAILDMGHAKEHIPAQFAYNLDESSDERFINIKLADMIEPRIIEL